MKNKKMKKNYHAFLITTVIIKKLILIVIGLITHFTLISCTSITDPNVNNPSDYKIKISTAFANLRVGRLDYGFTIQNEAITDATQLEIIIRFSFGNGTSTGSQEGLITETSTLGVGEAKEISSTLNDSDVKSPYRIDNIARAQIIAIRFYNIAKSTEFLAENTYKGVESNIPITR